jgi:hypothetical protein
MIGGTIVRLVSSGLYPLLIPFLLSRGGQSGTLLLLGVHVILETEGSIEEV